MKNSTAKILFSLLTSAVVLSGCTTEELVGERKGGSTVARMGMLPGIAGVAETETDTRTAITGTTLPTSTFFSLYGYKGTSVYTDAESEGTGVTLENEKVSNTGAFDSGDVYWPTANFTATPMNFYALHPYTTATHPYEALEEGDYTISVKSSNTGLVINYYMGISTKGGVVDLDLLYAKSGPYTAVPTDGKAALTFNHILAWLDIQAKVVDATAAGNAKAITINRSNITGIRTKGQYDGTTDTWSATLKGIGIRTIPTLSGSAVTLSDTYQSVGHIMSPPQPAFVSGNKLIVYYTFDGGTEKSLTIPYDKLPTLADHGKKYTMKIIFTVSDSAVKIAFDPITVTEWQDGTSSEHGENIKQ